VADDQCNEFHKDLTAGRFWSVNSECIVAQIGLVATEQLFGIITTLVKLEGFCSCHLLGGDKYKIAAIADLFVDDICLWLYHHESVAFFGLAVDGSEIFGILFRKFIINSAFLFLQVVHHLPEFGLQLFAFVGAIMLIIVNVEIPLFCIAWEQFVRDCCSADSKVMDPAVPVFLECALNLLDK